MEILLYASAIISGILLKRSKLVSAYILLVMVVLGAFRSQCADISNYFLEYQWVDSGVMTQDSARYLGFYFLQKICAALGMDFIQYQIVVFSISALLLFVAATILTRNVNFVLAMYLIFPFGIDAIQIKSLLAESVSLVAVSICLRDTKLRQYENKKDTQSDRKKFLFCLLLMVVAITIHFSLSLILLMMLLYRFSASSNIGKRVWAGTIIISFIIYAELLPKILNVVFNVFPVFDAHYISVWLQQKVGLGILIIIGEIGLIVSTSWFGRIMLCREYVSEKIQCISKNSATFITTMWLLVPFCMLDITFNRVFRIYIFVLYAMMSNLLNGRIDKKRKKILCFFMFFFTVAMMFRTDIYEVYDSTLGALLKFNQLL